MRTLKFPKLIIFFLLSPVFAQADTAQMMKDLVKMRAELETMNREMESLQKEKQNELELWTNKKLELEASVQKEHLRKLQLDEKISRLAQRVKSERKANPEAKTLFLTWLDKAHVWVNESLPYRKAQRLAVLASLNERGNRSLESYEVLSSELWMFYESELKMATDNEFRIVEVEIDEVPKKAEVARLGLYAMFSRTPDGVLRQSIFENGRWITSVLEAGRESDVVRLLTNMKAKKETGFYQLPLASKEVL